MQATANKNVIPFAERKVEIVLKKYAAALSIRKLFEAISRATEDERLTQIDRLKLIYLATLAAEDCGVVTHDAKGDFGGEWHQRMQTLGHLEPSEPFEWFVDCPSIPAHGSSLGWFIDIMFTGVLE